MKKVTIRRQFNPTYKGDPGHSYDLPSQTVPGMSLTPKQLLDNHARGIHSNIKVHNSQYFETEIPVFHDMVEAVEYKAELAAKIAKTEKEIQSKKEALKQENIKKAREEALKEEKVPQTPPKEAETPPKDD